MTACSSPDCLRTHRRLLAEVADPAGGADLGFVYGAEGWVRVRGGVATVIENANSAGVRRWIRSRWRGTRQIGGETPFVFARDAMEAK